MGKIADQIKKFLNEFLIKTLKSDLDFFSKSKALVVLQAAALAITAPLIVKLKQLLEKKLSRSLNKGDDKSLSFIDDPSNITDDDVIRYVKNNRDLQKFMQVMGNDLDDSISSEIVLACSNPNYYDKETNELRQLISKTRGGVDGNQYINIAKNQSDFGSKTNSYDLSGFDDIRNKLSDVLPWIFMVYFIIIKVNEFLTQSDHPSPYRGKYIQRLIRTVTAILKQELKSIGNVKKESNEGANEIRSQITEMISALSSLDAIIVGSLMASFIYLNNRKEYQSASYEAFKSEASNVVCGLSLEKPMTDAETLAKNRNLSEYNLNGLNSLITDNCPIETDNIAVPHEPIELKMAMDRLQSCSIDEEKPSSQTVSSSVQNDTATKACFENISTKQFKILVKPNQQVTSKTVLGVLGSEKVYSSIEGIVLSTKKNMVCMSDVSDPTESYLETLIKKSQDLYTELNNTKFFLKDFYINSMFPVMLKESPLIDASINATELGKIRFFTGGITQRFNVAKNSYQSAKDSYEKNVKTIAGEKNVKTKAENNKLIKIKEEIDSEDENFYNTLKSIYTLALNQSKVTMPMESEFVLSDYYYELYQSVLSYFDQNSILKSFRKKLSEILTNRFFIENWDETKLINKVNTMCNDLAKGTFFNTTPNFFNVMLANYTKNKSIKKVKDYVTNLAKNNKVYTEDEKQKIVDKVMFIFEFVLDIKQKINNKFKTSVNKYKATISEANYIQSFFNNLWKRYKEIPKELNDVLKKMDDVANTVTTYSIKKIDDEDYRYYSFGKPRTCKVPSESNDDYINGFSEFGFKDINYWLKYCAFATLVSVANPGMGWSTGLPPPIGPTLFPVVYIPIKAFQLEWGFIVIGLSITGIYPFPWVLFANLSSDYHVPFADPASVIKKQIKSLKKTLSTQLKDFKQKTLKEYLDKTKKDIDLLALEIEALSVRKKTHREDKPKRYRTQQDSAAIYARELAEWDAEQVIINEQLVSKRTSKFVSETKYKIVYEAFSGSKVKDVPDPKIKSIKKSEDQIDGQFSKLDALVNSIDPLLAPLPVSTQPCTANFAVTAKNPKPVIKFDEDLNDNVNDGALRPIIEKFKLKNESFMSSNLSSKSGESFTNFKKYKQTLKSSYPTTIKKDPFPKYENLKLTNVQWMAFLYNKWTPAGAKTYGIPGFSPFPI